jgi:hypothetical protein
MTRNLAGTVIIDGTDDELWPQSDQKVHRVFNIQMMLDEAQPASAMDIPDVRWGGECRVEVRITAKVISGNAIQIEGNAKLFEGASEDTTDQEDEQVVSFTVPKGGVAAHHGIQLRNSGTGGGDHAEISLSFTNSLVE